MNDNQLQTLIASYLEDMADQIEKLYNEGKCEEADLLREEGLEMAEAWDSHEVFMYINDLKTTR